MLFNSLTFLVFLSLMTVLYWLLNNKSRYIVLFFASLVFYGFWRWDFVLLMLFSTVIDYLVSLQLENTDKPRSREGLLFISLILNLGLLVVFKYSFFIVDNVNHVLTFFNANGTINPLSLILPLGISFYTFQTVSYTVDVYRRHLKAERNFFLYGTYVTFFPQLVAGPILRATEVIPELISRKSFKLDYLFEGGKRILYGLFLKVVLADNIAPLVNSGFSQSVATFTGLDVMVLAFLFGFQIYFDFAGYSHIAIGCAKLMGITFPENFNFPYMASSFKAFWKRWHISLSSWIRDYLYLPILGVKVSNKDSLSQGGIEVVNNKKTRSPAFALFATWTIMGLWHGANWTFVFWGLYHATFIFIERQIHKVKRIDASRKFRLIGWLIVLPISMLSWIPFRALNLNDTFSMYGKLFNPSGYLHYSLRENLFLIAALLMVGVILAFCTSKIRLPETPFVRLALTSFKVVKYAIMLFLVFVFLRPISQFIYFQF